MLQLLGAAAYECAALARTILRPCQVAHKLATRLLLQQPFDHVAELQFRLLLLLLLLAFKLIRAGARKNILRN